MAAATERLSLAEFQLRYGKSDEAYEYWHGEAVRKGMPTWIHAFLQGVLMELLKAAGYKTGGDLELRIVPDARLRPDVVGTKRKLQIPYPTEAIEVAIEILSSDDSMAYMLQKCAAYQEWGFEFIYVVDPEPRKVYRWTARGLEATATLVSIPTDRIWEALDQALQ